MNGIHPRETLAYVQLDTCARMFIELPQAAKMWKQSKCPSMEE
jgi:hypothetical protein